MSRYSFFLSRASVERTPGNGPLPGDVGTTNGPHSSSSPPFAFHTFLSGEVNCLFPLESSHVDLIVLCPAQARCRVFRPPVCFIIDLFFTLIFPSSPKEWIEFKSSSPLWGACLLPRLYSADRQRQGPSAKSNASSPPRQDFTTQIPYPNNVLFPKV